MSIQKESSEDVVVGVGISETNDDQDQSTTTTDNHNFLQNVSFEFGIGRFPNMNFFVQSVTMPGIDLGQSQISYWNSPIQILLRNY